MANELNDLPEAPAEDIVTEEPEETPVIEPAEAAAAEEKTPPPVDETPDPESLKSEIKALEEKRKKLEEDARYWREQKAQERAKYFKEKQGEQTPTPTAEPQGLKRPVPADFEDYDQYVDALTDYKVEVKRREWDRDASQQQQNQEIKQREAELQAKIQRGFEKYDDFEDVALDQTVPITPAIKEILMDSENPEDVAYYLGKNRAEAIRISRMTPYKAARAIAKIEMDIQAPPPKTQQQNKITGAPPPIKPVGSSGSGSSKNPEQMTGKEFEKWRLEQGARRY